VTSNPEDRPVAADATPDQPAEVPVPPAGQDPSAAGAAAPADTAAAAQGGDQAAEQPQTEPAGTDQPSSDQPSSDQPSSDEDRLATEIAAEIAELAAERDQYRDIAQRVQADFENYRKRVHQQIRDEAERAAARMAEALLPVLDAAEAAYLRHPDEVGPLLNAMLAELRKQGLETVDLEGKPFDPNVAEAVAHDHGSGGEVIVAEVLRSGYTWKGRTLRPAMVRTRD
jgi:molecular chaperone GrpE